MPVGGIPILGRWIDLLDQIGVDQIIINTHHLSAQVDEFVAQHRRGRSVTVTHEETLLGTAGTVRQNYDFFQGTGGFVIHADNFYSGGLGGLARLHGKRPTSTVATLMAHRVEAPEKYGIFSVNNESIMTRFWEKSTESIGNLANSAIYYFEREALADIASSNEIIDLSTDYLPTLTGRALVYESRSPVIDIGTIDGWRLANRRLENQRKNESVILI
jgi:mannose-1-phosphate guanylyltransferase